MGHAQPAKLEPVAGEAADFATFYRRELDGQVRRAALLLGSEAAAADAVHDAFVAVYQRWPRIEEPGPYLNRAVLNRCRDMARATDRARGVLHRLIGDCETAEYDPLWDVLINLPFNQRAAVVLKYYARLTETEIAGALDCPTGSIGPWISRALTALRKELS